MNETAKQTLAKKLEAGALAAGFPTEQWTQARVKQVIEQAFGVVYHRKYISRLLHKLGWSVQKPDSRAMEWDEALIQAWLRRDWPRIKKARRIGADIVFEDEFVMSYTEPVSFTWAPRGQTPCFKRIGKYRRETSTVIGLTISGSIFKRHFDGSVNAEKLIAGLEHFRKHIRRPILLIWDRSPVHRAKFVQTYLANHSDLHQEYLPAYAPETNPEEYCHGNVKRSLQNAIFITKDEIHQHLDRSFARLRKRPNILLGLFHHTHLTLKQLW